MQKETGTNTSIYYDFTKFGDSSIEIDSKYHSLEPT
jgi:hypothetical protein